LLRDDTYVYAECLTGWMQLGWRGVHVFVDVPNIKTSSSVFSPKAGMQGVIV
jgi:hypothetical protein